MKKNIAIVWGGYSSEKEVSEKSAEGIYSFIDKEKYNVYKVKIDKKSWETECNNNTFTIDKNDFSFKLEEQIVKFDFAYITIHGTPGEDGKLQGYLDMLDIPYSNSGVLSSSLTFSKFTCNNYLRSFGIHVADSMFLLKNTSFDAAEIIAKLGLPVFVKPNIGGSSFATTKVKVVDKLKGAISDAFEEAPEVMVESFISGIEVTCGCFRSEKGIHVLPLTEVVTHNEFFDYAAKYKGEVEEITPARVPEELTREIQQLTQTIYELVNARGIIRVDFIISENKPILLEVNTTPGMTPTSFIPQQVKAADLSIRDVLTHVIEFEYNHK